MNTNLGEMYQHHHSTKRGSGFVLLGKERGGFLKEEIGIGKKVLDIGCRDGALTSYFSEGNEVIGVDIDIEALSRAEEKLGIRTQVMDLNGDWSELPKNKFDVVVAAEVVEHLYYPNLVFEKIHNVLKPEGMFLGTVPNAFSIKNRLRLLMLQKKNTPLEDPTHINHFTVKELRNLLLQSFSKVEMYGVGNAGYFAKRYPQLFAFNLFFKASK